MKRDKGLVENVAHDMETVVFAFSLSEFLVLFQDGVCQVAIRVKDFAHVWSLFTFKQSFEFASRIRKSCFGFSDERTVVRR